MMTDTLTPKHTLNVRARALNNLVHFNDIRPKEDIIECLEEVQAVLEKHKMYLLFDKSHVTVKEKETSRQRAQFFMFC